MDIALSAEKGTNEEPKTLLLQELGIYGNDFTLIANAKIFEDILNLIRALRSPRPLTQEQQNLLLTIISMPAITSPAYRLFSMKNFDITLGLLPIIPGFAAASILEHMMLRDFFGEVVYKYHRAYFIEAIEELHSANAEIPAWFQPLKGTEFTASLGNLFANSNGIIFIDPYESVEHLAYVLIHEQLHRIHRRVRFIGKNKREERIGFAELGISEQLFYSMEEYMTEAFSLLLVAKGDIREALNLANMFASNRYAQGAKRFLELLRHTVHPEKSVDALKFVLESYQAAANGEVEYAWDLLRDKYEEKCRTGTDKDCSFYAEFPSLTPSVGGSMIPTNFLGICHIVKRVLDSMYNLDNNFVKQYLKKYDGALFPGMEIDHNGFKKAIEHIRSTVASTSPPDKVEEILGQNDMHAVLYNYAMRVATVMLNLAVSHKSIIEQVTNSVSNVSSPL